MGVVYVARQEALNRRVALKIVKNEIADQTGIRTRFLAEARRAGTLDHPHIIDCYDAGEHQGLLYLAMRFVEGGDLEARLQRDPKPSPTEAVGMLAQIAGALDQAHASELVHRDVKPANILIDSKRQVGVLPFCYLADFGTAISTAARARLTKHGEVIGTLLYTAPEQIEGVGVTKLADQYALGCVLFECLTGDPPFPPGEVAVTPLMAAHLYNTPPRATDRDPALPAALDKVFAKVLAKKPHQRFQSCTKFIEAVREALVQGQDGGGQGQERLTIRRPKLVDELNKTMADRSDPRRRVQERRPIHGVLQFMRSMAARARVGGRLLAAVLDRGTRVSLAALVLGGLLAAAVYISLERWQPAIAHLLPGGGTTSEMLVAADPSGMVTDVDIRLDNAPISTFPHVPPHMVLSYDFHLSAPADPDTTVRVSIDDGQWNIRQLSALGPNGNFTRLDQEAVTDVTIAPPELPEGTEIVRLRANPRNLEPEQIIEGVLALQHREQETIVPFRVGVAGSFSRVTGPSDAGGLWYWTSTANRRTEADGVDVEVDEPGERARFHNATENVSGWGSHREPVKARLNESDFPAWVRHVFVQPGDQIDLAWLISNDGGAPSSDETVLEVSQLDKGESSLLNGLRFIIRDPNADIVESSSRFDLVSSEPVRLKPALDHATLLPVDTFLDDPLESNDAWALRDDHDSQWLYASLPGIVPGPDNAQVATLRFDVVAGDSRVNTDRDPEGRTVLAVGDCIVWTGAPFDIDGAARADCDDWHHAEVYDRLPLTGAADRYPARIRRDAESQCIGAFENVTGQAYRDHHLWVSPHPPTRQQWTDGDRQVICLAHDFRYEPRQGSSLQQDPGDQDQRD